MDATVQVNTQAGSAIASITGAAGCWIVLSCHDQLIACCHTYAAALDVCSAMAMSHRRWVHSARWYALKDRNYRNRRAAKAVQA